MKLRIQHLYLMLIISTLFSCTTMHYVPIDILKPPAKQLPQEVKSILVINKGVHATHYMSFLQQDRGYPMFLDTMLSGDLVRGICYSLDNSERYTVKTPFGTEPTDKIEYNQLSKGSFTKKLCEKYEADIIIVLERFKTWGGFHSSNYRNYNPNRKFFIKYKLRVYYPDKLEILDEFSFERSYYDISFKKAENNSYDLGMSYAQSFLPEWKPVTRNYYHNEQHFEGAFQLAENKEWLKAAEIWKTMIDSDNEKFAAKAMYNLAITNEMEGKLHEALEWAEKSYEKHSKMATYVYIQELKTRIEDQKKLKLFYEGE